MKKEFVKVALCQRHADGGKDKNLTETLMMVEQAVKECPALDIIAFPEYNYYCAEDPADTKANAEPLDGRYVVALCEAAKKWNVNIIGGSFAAASGDKVKNTIPFIDRNGKLAGTYSKLHLMDAIGIKESDSVDPGDNIAVIDTDFGRIGLMVCFDLRFPELPRSMVYQGADMIFCCASFPTGAALPPRVDHWDLMVRSSALYNLTYFCATNQFGMLHNGRDNNFGRSCVIDPWGTVVVHATEKTGIVYATLDMAYQEQVRKNVATWQCRRPDVYTLG